MIVKPAAYGLGEHARKATSARDKLTCGVERWAVRMERVRVGR